MTNTHAVSKPNQQAPMPIDTFRMELSSASGDYYKKIVNYFGGDEEKARKFCSALVYSVQKNPKLLESDRNSLFTAGMACAEFKLYPSNVAGEAFLIPYKGKVQFQIGYQGLVTLLFRAGITLQAEIVRKDDKFRYVTGLNTILEHSPDPFKATEERGEPIGAYAVAKLPDGRSYHKFMNAADILGFKDFSQGKDSEYSPWKSKNDPEMWMWKKTVIKQLCKTIPKTEEINKAIAEDNEDSVVAARKGQLDAAGPATGVPSHDPAANAPESPQSDDTPKDDVTIVPDPEQPEAREKCKAGRHHVDYEDGKGNCTECAKEKKGA